MQELTPGLWHWIGEHPKTGLEVSSYYLASERVLLDPMVPPEGTGWFSSQGAEPEHIVLTNRHHDRDSWTLREAFGCHVHCIDNGAYEIEDRGPVERFSFGDELSGGIVAYEVGAICPDETALHIPEHRALAVADGVVRLGDVEGLSFVPDWLMDDPPDTRRRLCEAYRNLLDLDLDFDLLLLAHGAPVTADGKAALRQFADRN